MSPLDPNRVPQIEESIRRIRGVLAARIRLQDDTISEVHIVAGEARRPKGVVRDVVTMLFAQHGLTVHHQKVSVATIDGQGDAAEEAESLPEPRIQFRSVNVYRQENRAEAQVELVHGGQNLIGTSSGPAIRASLPRLVARATLQALGRFLGEGTVLELVALEQRRLGGRRIMLSHVAVLQQRDETHLTGSVLVTSDPLEATVFSVLDAVNRVLPGLEEEDHILYEVEAVGPEVGR